MVPKPYNRAWRPSVDFWNLKEKTVPDNYLISDILDFNMGLKGTNIFTKLDLFKIYYQIPIAEMRVFLSLPDRSENVENPTSAHAERNVCRYRQRNHIRQHQQGRSVNRH